MQCTRTRSALLARAQGYAGGPLCATQTLRGSAGTCSHLPSVAIGRRCRGRAHKKRDVPISALPLGITDGHDPLSGFGVGFSSAAYLDRAHPTAGAWHWPWRKYNNTAEAHSGRTQSQPGPLPPRQIVSGRAMDTVRQRVKDFAFVKVHITSAPSQRGSVVLMPSLASDPTAGRSCGPSRRHHLLPPVLPSLPALCQPSQVPKAQGSSDWAHHRSQSENVRRHWPPPPSFRGKQRRHHHCFRAHLLCRSDPTSTTSHRRASSTTL